jgi:hypothetical protein
MDERCPVTYLRFIVMNYRCLPLNIRRRPISLGNGAKSVLVPSNK